MGEVRRKWENAERTEGIRMFEEEERLALLRGEALLIGKTLPEFSRLGRAYARRCGWFDAAPHASGVVLAVTQLAAVRTATPGQKARLARGLGNESAAALVHVAREDVVPARLEDMYADFFPHTMYSLALSSRAFL